MDMLSQRIRQYLRPPNYLPRRRSALLELASIRILKTPKSAVQSFAMAKNSPTFRLDYLDEDVLRIIMDLAIHGLEHDLHKLILQSPQTAIRVSHVSRRFRALALSSSTLWTNIHGFMLPEAMRAFLERSRDADLRLAFVLDDSHIRNVAVDNDVDDEAAMVLFRQSTLFDAVSPHAKRWRSIHILPDFNTSDEFHPFLRWQTGRLRCSLALQNGPFPRLEHLDARFHEPMPMHKGFYSCWDAPALKELVIANAPPCVLHHASITKFSFVWDQWSPQNASIEKELLAFLQATPTIQDLSFRIDRNGIGLLDFASLRFEAMQPLELPNITTLSLFTVSLSMAPTFHALLDRLSLPNISRLIVHAGIDRHDCKTVGPVSSNLQTFIWVLSMIPDPELSRFIKDVELRVFAGTSNEDRGRPQFQIPFVKLGNVENLTLETDMPVVWSFSADSGDSVAGSWTSESGLMALTSLCMHPINLRSLRLERCLNVDAQLFRMLMETLRQQGKGEQLKAFSVFECDAALTSSVEEIAIVT